ncbi:MAG: YdcF family protein [Gloeocapsa sp. DLM2.Bin57]|nr:MAG: YdcF family protein [Gloeocapsa sp. DLM2.Bin57]
MLLLCLVLLVSIIPLRLALTVYQVQNPQAIVILGGDLQRFAEAITFTQIHPELDIWISCGERQCRGIQRFLDKIGFNQDQVYYDSCPTDTVTNFTCTLNILLNRNIRYVYLLTSDYHLSRSVAIAVIVFGSRGIAFQPISLPSTQSRQESWLVILRDFLRSLFWLFTGKTGAQFK